MRKVIGNLVGYTGLALLVGAALFALWQFAIVVLPLVWRVASSGDTGAIAWLAAVVGIALTAVGVAVYPDEPKAP